MATNLDRDRGYARGGGRAGSEPEVAHAGFVARQVGKSFETVEMVDREVGDGFRRREAEIDGDATTAVRPALQAAPTEYAATGGAEEDFE